MEEAQSNCVFSKKKSYVKTDTMDITELVNWSSEEIGSKIQNLTPSALETIKLSNTEILQCDLRYNNEFKLFKFCDKHEQIIKKFPMDVIWTEKLVYSILNQKLYLDYNVSISFFCFFVL